MRPLAPDRAAMQRVRLAASPTTARASTASPRTTACATVGGTLGRGHRHRSLGHPVALTAAGRTDTGVHAWGQVVSFDVPAEQRALDLDALQPQRQRAVRRRRSWCARPSGSRPTSTPGSRPAGGATATPCSTTPCPTRSWPPRRGTSTGRSTCGRMRLACDPLRRRARLLVVLPPAQAARTASPPATLVRRVLSARWDDVGRRAAAAAAVRDHGQRLLPPDGPLHRRHAGRGGVGPPVGGLDPRHDPGPGPVDAPASSRRPTACACGRSATD